MKKTLLTLLMASAFINFANNASSQNIRIIDAKDVKKTEIIKDNRSYEERFKEIDSIKNDGYKEMLKEIKNPTDAKIYCTKIMKYGGEDIDSIKYGEGDYWASFKQSYDLKLQDCDDAAISAAALLYDNGFHPYLLALHGEKSNHLLFLYRNEHGKYGTVGMNNQDCQEPKKLEDLIKRFQDIYFQEKIKFYSILDVEGIFPDAIDKEGNYKRLEEVIEK